MNKAIVLPAGGAITGFNKAEIAMEAFGLIVQIGKSWDTRKNIKAITEATVTKMKLLDDHELSVLLDAVVKTGSDKMLEVFHELKRLQMENKFKLAVDCQEKISSLRGGQRGA